MEDLRGMRVPFLRVGWNRQFLMMKEFGFVFDSSMVAPFSNPPLWPYTLDYKMPHSCTGNNQHVSYIFNNYPIDNHCIHVSILYDSVRQEVTREFGKW